MSGARKVAGPLAMAKAISDDFGRRSAAGTLPAPDNWRQLAYRLAIALRGLIEAVDQMFDQDRKAKHVRPRAMSVQKLSTERGTFYRVIFENTHQQTVIEAGSLQLFHWAQELTALTDPTPEQDAERG